ncbi:unnamed protein product [Mesocestoides corti]|uniref:RNI-like protein n=2 Tax=Mesocestoides corti TaxID=53468 RepID=A0A0R3U4E7_MESCO|nr:unnamed protein product [Mesocestoides corti]
MPSDTKVISPTRRKTSTSFAKSVFPVPDTPPQSRRKSKHVRFPEDDDKLTSSIYGADEAWRVDPDTPNDKVVDGYAAFCARLNRPPISSIIEQLSVATVHLATTKIPAIILKGTQLSLKDIEALEYVFKYCQAYHMSFENTNIDDKSLACLLDSLDYFAPCRELCLARNKHLTSEGIKLLGSFLSKYPILTWLDIRGIPLLYADAQAVGIGLRGQYNVARPMVTKFTKLRTGDEPQDPDALRDMEDAEAFKWQLQYYLPKSPTDAERDAVTAALRCLPVLCLRGLHLGETGICGEALGEVAGAIRIAGHLRDLRLPKNRLGPRDMEVLTPLLRYYPGLQVLDLSYNDLGDEGFRVLSNAISRPSYPTSCFDKPEVSNSSRLSCNLRRLYLAASGLRPTGANHLANCLNTLGHLTHLELSDNVGLGCQGLLAMRSGLQAFTRKRLLYLGLARCNLACQGAIALAEVLGDSPRVIRRIDLTGNHIAEAGLMAISKSVPLCPELVQLQGLEDNRPIKHSTNGASVNGPATSRSHPSSPLFNGLSARFSAFKFSRNNPPFAANGEESSVPSIWSRRRSSSRTVSLSEPSQLSLDLLRVIHAQLAANVDERIAARRRRSSKSRPSKTLQKAKTSLDKSTELRFFRGYVRFPTATDAALRQSDPRHLCGDTSDSDVDVGSTPPARSRRSSRMSTADDASSMVLRSDCLTRIDSDVAKVNTSVF